MTNTHAELLKLQTSAEEEQNKETSSNNELIERKQIDRTPFYIVGNKEKGYFLAMGNYRLTEPKPNMDDVHRELHENRWMIVMNMIITIMEGQNKIIEARKAMDKEKDTSKNQ